MKKIVSLFFLCVVIFTNQDLTFASLYSDVDSSTWYYNSILDLNEQGVMTGNPDGTFQPDKCVNRAEMVKLVLETIYSNQTIPYLRYSSEEIKEESQFINYTDITDKSAWYVDYIITATIEGIVQGYPDLTFRPGDCVNRAEATKIVMESFKISTFTIDENSKFSDVPKGEWFTKYILAASAKQILPENHTQNTSLYSPSEPMTRKEAAYLINKGFKLSQEELPKRSRDAGRKALLNSTAVAVLSYSLDNGSYPVGSFCIDNDSLPNSPEEELVQLYIDSKAPSYTQIPNATVCNGEFVRYESIDGETYQIFIEVEVMSPGTFYLNSSYSDSKNTPTDLNITNTRGPKVFSIVRD